MPDASAPDLVVDRITNVTLINGVMRIALERIGADNQGEAVATLFLPASQVNNFLNGLNNAAKDIVGQMQERNAEAAEEKPEAAEEKPKGNKKKK